jgi:Kef-type K+ transport system membrane component KefB
MDLRFLLDRPWLVFVAVCTTLFAAAVGGYRLARFTGINEDSHHHEHITSLREGLFILLGLLLGFSVAMVLPRFDQRTQLVVDEANAIETTMLGAEMLPEPQRGKALELLREYVPVRLDFARQSLLDRPELDRETRRTRAIQQQLWQQMVADRDPQPAVVQTYVKPLTNMIEVAEQRLAAFENRVPLTVWLIIFLIAVFQSFATGYSLKRRFWFSLVMTPVVVAVVMALLADLDSPHGGLINVRENSMERLANDVTDPPR